MAWDLHFWHDQRPMKTSSSAENLNLHLETIFERELDLGRRRLIVSGTSSPSFLALFLSSSNHRKINKLPHLVVTSSLAEANRFQQALQFFDPSRDALILSNFDVSPYSSLDPRMQNTSSRLNFLYRAQNARPGDILIAPIASLLQKTIPFSVLKKNSFRFEKNSDLPEDLHSFLAKLGYQSSPLVEDVGQYSMRGGIVDIFSPAHDLPVRIELFGETIESLRFFSTADQRSQSDASSFILLPCREALFEDEIIEPMLDRFRASWVDRDIERSEAEEMLRALSRKQLTSGFDFLLPFFYPNLESPLEHFSSSLNIWMLDPISIARESDQLLTEMKSDFNSSTRHVVRPPVESFFQH
ncbi:MAG: transcription-repair coupling factor, partial [Pseudobdellovibrionaceae bacterium]